MKFQPLGNRVMVEPMDMDPVSPGGVHLPETMKEKTIKGKVVAVGYGRYTETGALIKPVARVGDEVILAKGSHNTEVVMDGKSYLVMRDEDLLGRNYDPVAELEAEKVQAANNFNKVKSAFEAIKTLHSDPDHK